MVYVLWLHFSGVIEGFHCILVAIAYDDMIFEETMVIITTCTLAMTSINTLESAITCLCLKWRDAQVL